jgi:AraC-like DNA-binding protein
LKHQTEYVVSPGWGLLLADAGINASNVLRRAGLPRDLFKSGQRTITIAQCFALWEGIQAESGDPLLPISVGQAISMEAFDVPLFAATCSPNLNVAAHRLAKHKKLIGPMKLSVVESENETVLEFIWPPHATPPQSLSMTELVFWVALVRLTTRAPIRPVRVTSPDLPEDAEAYQEYFGVRIQPGAGYTVAFTARDAKRPFLTANDRMWEFFEPELRRRLSELEVGTTVAERVCASLLELLPAGNGSMEAVAHDLAMSPRTLQRRLKEEDSTFQAILDSTRESLARHYLTESELSAGEISFLLGYEDPRSFYRAFRAWTGQTPNLVRATTG